MKKSFDLLIVGQPSLDINVDHLGKAHEEVGGAVVYSAHAADALGARVGIAPKLDAGTIDISQSFADAPEVTIFPVASTRSTSIENIYLSADRERRRSSLVSAIDPYTVEDLPDVNAAVWYLAGLVRSDIPDEVISHAADLGRCAVDVQSVVRCAVPSDGSMEYRDWPAKHELLPRIEFLKTDAAEAEILTGLSDRREAARLLHDWGAKEIMVTHHTEVLVFDGDTFHVEPLRPRGLSGRSGRGDTCFATYVSQRLHHSAAEALRTAAGLTSLKMDKPGPFTGTRADVEEFIRTDLHPAPQSGVTRGRAS